MKNKGFTLIELLAVIVILAIIALIATPIILNIINDSKKSADERSVELYKNAVEQAVVKENLSREFHPNVCNIQTGGDLICDGDTEHPITVSMSNPENIQKGGKVVFEDSKLVAISAIKISGDTFSLHGNGKVSDAPCILNSGSINTAGSEVICGTEEFYIVSSDDTNVTMLAKYNLDVGYIFNPDSETDSLYTLISNPTGRQSKKTLEKYYDEFDETYIYYYGMVDFADSAYWQYVYPINAMPYIYDMAPENDSMRGYLNAYAEYLEIDRSKVKLLNIQQANSLGCNFSNSGYESLARCKNGPSWLTTGNYYLGNAASSQMVFAIADRYPNKAYNATYNEVSTDAWIAPGVRPVVTIAKSNIQ